VIPWVAGVAGALNAVRTDVAERGSGHVFFMILATQLITLFVVLLRMLLLTFHRRWRRMTRSAQEC
jgi:hypothetical protein